MDLGCMYMTGVCGTDATCAQSYSATVWAVIPSLLLMSWFHRTLGATGWRNSVHIMGASCTLLCWELYPKLTN